MEHNSLNIKQFLTTSFSRKKLSHAYLFFGGTTSEKLKMSAFFAKLVLQINEDSPQAKLIEEHQHANVIHIAPDGATIKKDQIQFLKTESTKTAIENNAKVFVINEAEKMSTSAINSLLKFLEEPSPEIYIILLANDKDTLLPTITSRTINLKFTNKNQLDAEQSILDFIFQYELHKGHVEPLVAKHHENLKEWGPNFFKHYSTTYQKVIDLHLSVDIKSSDIFVENTQNILMLKQKYDIKQCSNKIKLALICEKNLNQNMNFQLCFDYFMSENKKIT